jgi:hypothetical protein
MLDTGQVDRVGKDKGKWLESVEAGRLESLTGVDSRSGRRRLLISIY